MYKTLCKIILNSWCSVCCTFCSRSWNIE